MKICVVSRDASKDYTGETYPFMLEMCAAHDALVRSGNEISLVRVSTDSERNISSRRNIFPYTQVVDYGVVDVDDPSIDVFHLCELVNDKSWILRNLLERVAISGKPVVYTDSDAEVRSTFKGPNIRWVIQNINLLIVHVISRGFINQAKELSGQKVVYIPYFLSESMLSGYGVQSIPSKTKDFVYVGGLSGRPHLVEFVNLALAEGFSFDVGLAWYDRAKSKGSLLTDYSKVGDINSLVGLKINRLSYYRELSKYRFTYIGSGWHFKRELAFIPNNPDCTTFRPLEMVLSRMLALSYKTPELVEAGIDHRLLMDWNSKNYDNEKRALIYARQIVDGGEYLQLQEETSKRILSVLGPHVGLKYVELFTEAANRS